MLSVRSKEFSYSSFTNTTRSQNKIQHDQRTVVKFVCTVNCLGLLTIPQFISDMFITNTYKLHDVIYHVYC